MDNIKKIHFIGIGGAGMYPMAKILKEKGYTISGSDANESENTDKLKELGINIYIGQDVENIQDDIDLVVYSAAIKEDNPELMQARKSNIKTIDRAEMLGMLISLYKEKVTVSGTHGKTTTTGMITQILVASGKDPTAVIGGRLPLIDGNGINGSSDIVVCEACEYVDSFLKLDPSIAVVLNIDIDHLDYFKNLENIKKSFHNFMNKSEKVIIVNGDDENIIDALKGIENKEIISFGFGHGNDYYADNIINDKMYQRFDLICKGKKIADIELNVPGKHNIYNALAAIVASICLGVDINDVKKSIKEFKGVHRRFEYVGKINGMTIIDDFAHTPTEIEATITTALKLGYDRVVTIFQPHTFSRTIALFDDFIKILSLPDKVIIAPIYASREIDKGEISSKKLADRIDGAIYLENFKDIVDFVLENSRPNDLILTIGAGDVYKCGKMIMNKSDIDIK